LASVDFSSIEPFEICSIRPPTENNSLTFRLTRNCYWNKCGFCPVYKFGARFCKRTLPEIQRDIARARRINDLMDEFGISFYGRYASSAGSDYQKVNDLMEKIKVSRKTPAASAQTPDDHRGIQTDDPQLAWFLQWFKDKPTIEDSLTHVLNWRLNGGQTCFLGDADSLILKPDFLGAVISDVKHQFPTIRRFTIYGRTASAARLRTLSDLKYMKTAGLDRVHFGIESGSDEVLSMVKKGESRSDHIDGCLKTKEAGLSCSVYVMPGLGGEKFSDLHAHETAKTISAISPDFVRLRSLQIFPQTPLAHARDQGDFVEATEEQLVKEIRIMVSEINAETSFMSDSASNLLNINGQLPRDRNAMLQEIDAYLALTSRQKEMFSLESRLMAFKGQYGVFTKDIYSELIPYISKGGLDIGAIPENQTRRLIQMIREKLMP
jgi:radical SAM superfamily enzyme YgiQ (UPF0313 family)